MIVRTTNLNINVHDVADAVDSITVAVQRRGGYVASSNFKNEGERRTASMSVRVPSREADEFMREMRRLAVKVNEEATTSQDVTEEYSDLSAQLRNLEATEQQYLELMKRAQSVDDILKVQQRLNEVRGQIERIKGRLQSLERRSDFAQVNITLIPEVPARDAWDPLRVARQAWEASLLVLERVADVTITVVVFLWWVIPLGAVGYAAALAIRQRRLAARPQTRP